MTQDAETREGALTHRWGVYQEKHGYFYIALDTGMTFVERVDHFADMAVLADYANRGYELRHYPGWRGRLARWLVRTTQYDGTTDG